MLRRLSTSALALALLAAPRMAGATSRLFVDDHAGAGSRLAHVREARAEGPTRVTTWISAHVEGAPAHVAWVLSLPPDAAVDVGATSWLDALESATAPRRPPSRRWRDRR